MIHINELINKINSLIIFFTSHIKLIFKPKELVDYILKESTKNLFVKTILLIFSNYYFFKFLIWIFNTDKISNFKQIPLVIVIFSIVHSICFYFIYLSIKINFKDKIKLSFFSSIIVFSSILPIQILIFFCFLITELYFFYFAYFIVCILCTYFIFIKYPLHFNKKLFLFISILFSYISSILINTTTNFSIKNLTGNDVVLDPIFHEFMENEPKCLEISKYMNSNNMLIINLTRSFSERFSYSYYVLLKNQILTVISKKGDIEKLLASTKFMKNKKKLILNLEIIEIFENILFEYNRLILDSNQDFLDVVELQIEEGQEAIANTKEKYNRIKEKLNEYEKLNLDMPPQEIIDEAKNLLKETEQIKNKNKEIKLLTDKLSINNNATREINLLIEKLNNVFALLIDEEKKSIDYIEWRIKIPF